MAVHAQPWYTVELDPPSLTKGQHICKVPLIVHSTTKCLAQSVPPYVLGRKGGERREREGGRGPVPSLMHGLTPFSPQRIKCVRVCPKPRVPMKSSRREQHHTIFGNCDSFVAVVLGNMPSKPRNRKYTVA